MAAMSGDDATEADAGQFADLVRTRRSVRAFLDTDVSRAQIQAILDMARHAPSGGNMQPWNVHVLGRQTIGELGDAIRTALAEPDYVETGDYRYYPARPVAPYGDRIRQAGHDLYEALGIGRRDVAARREQKLKNFDFFGAPAGLLVTIDARLERGSWIDVGLFLNTLSLAIVSQGLGCCLQASFSSHGDAVRRVLGLERDALVVCGVAVGHPDETHPVNRQPLRRQDVAEFVRFHP
jgi:nitroreductase